MAYYHTCPDCGAHLDPGEECDCGKENYEFPNKEKDNQSEGYRKVS